MQESGQRRSYQSVQNMDGQGQTKVPGRKFHVSVAGCTNGAHQTYVNDLKGMGQIEVVSPEQSDYLVLFCPIASRVGKDIGEAMDKIPGGKPIVLVVMHHTYDKDHFVPESRRLVENPDVIVTVDVLFHQSKMLTCNRNDTAWFQVKGVLPGPVSSWLSYIREKISDIGEAMDKISGMPAVQRFMFWCGFISSCVNLCGWCMKLCGWCMKLWPLTAPVLIWMIIGGIVVVVVVIIVSVAVHYAQK